MSRQEERIGGRLEGEEGRVKKYGEGGKRGEEREERVEENRIKIYGRGSIEG